MHSHVLCKVSTNSVSSNKFQTDYVKGVKLGGSGAPWEFTSRGVPDKTGWEETPGHGRDVLVV